MESPSHAAPAYEGGPRVLEADMPEGSAGEGWRFPADAAGNAQPVPLHEVPSSSAQAFWRLSGQWHSHVLRHNCCLSRRMAPLRRSPVPDGALVKPQSLVIGLATRVRAYGPRSSGIWSGKRSATTKRITAAAALPLQAWAVVAGSDTHTLAQFGLPADNILVGLEERHALMGAPSRRRRPGAR